MRAHIHSFSLYSVVYRFVVYASSRLLISSRVVVYAIICLLFILICLQLLFMLLNWRVVTVLFPDLLLTSVSSMIYQTKLLPNDGIS